VSLDVLGRVLIEIRDDSGVAAITDRIRGAEPGGNLNSPDVQPAGKYRPFVVLSQLAGPPSMSVPTADFTIGMRCYGATYQDAATLYRACSAAVHRKGPRVSPSGLGIYVSHDVSGGSASKDPDTGQPYVFGVISLIATTQVVV
jgi:hypothetical protein